MLEISVELIYMVAIALFVIGLKRMTSPATARTGNQMAAVAMFIGVIVTMLDRNILNFELIIAGIVVGGLIGGVAAKKVEMTSMPEMVALFNGVGGLSSVLVALGEYYRYNATGQTMNVDAIITVGLSVLIGAVTFTGSIMAFAKLKGIITGNPISFPLQTALNGFLLFVAFVATAFVVVDQSNELLFLSVLGIAVVLGVLVVLPIGGADMPVVISLLNSYSGVAASMAGFVLGNKLLIVAGALVGSAGLILTIIMCKAMNRSLTNVLFGAFGGDKNAVDGRDIDKTYREMMAEDVAILTAYAQRVVIVPGYGLAVAQAQHVVREVADILESKGVDVRYGIHPVAGRMPGHMNVLLAEANIPYNQLYDMDDINPDFEKTDVVLIIGANDVVNPDARENPASPIYGMPILNVDKAKATIVLKRSMNPGFAGIDNVLFYKSNNYMYFGDAKKSLQNLVTALKEL
ncbi:MAG: NAD(P)(+) transhydrogenase (Re/Si-specific) subunit beta [Bacteroidetes bacterium]|nr:NAD(P)(+) transhydrogenase (Re/Si-specific) subunit beta [Bacteroidota bacterium]NCQ11633.1 NAD(P)(+) transhydrogenase (Re/Si-specific) subunit beta [Bacteroidota bacterium]